MIIIIVIIITTTTWETEEHILWNWHLLKRVWHFRRLKQLSAESPNREDNCPENTYIQIKGDHQSGWNLLSESWNLQYPNVKLHSQIINQALKKDRQTMGRINCRILNKITVKKI